MSVSSFNPPIRTLLLARLMLAHVYYKQWHARRLGILILYLSA